MARGRTKASVVARMERLGLHAAKVEDRVVEPVVADDFEVEPVTIAFGSHSIQSPLHSNEDRVVRHVGDAWHCFATIDGHGGAEAAEFLRTQLVQVAQMVLFRAGLLRSNFSRSSKPIDEPMDLLPL